MTTTTYGSKYAETKDLRSVEIAKLIRADIKAAIKAGELPAGLKCSVRYESFSGGCAIRVRVTAVPEGFTYWRPEFLAHEARNPHVLFEGDRITVEAKAILKVLNKIHAAYNYDGSDIQSDYFNVRYYGDAEFGWELQRDDRKRTIERMVAANREAVAAAEKGAHEAQARVEASNRRIAELQDQAEAARIARDAVAAELAARAGYHAGEA